MILISFPGIPRDSAPIGLTALLIHITLDWRSRRSPLISGHVNSPFKWLPSFSTNFFSGPNEFDEQLSCNQNPGYLFIVYIGDCIQPRYIRLFISHFKDPC